LTELGYNLNDDEVNRGFIRFKELADKKKEISNLDIESIINDEIQMISKNRYKLNNVQIICGDKQIPTATITILDEFNNKETTTSQIGTGPVDAAYKAIIHLTFNKYDEIKLLEYTVSSVTAGIDAIGEVTVRLQDLTNNRKSMGRSANTDVIVASAQAYLNAINKLILLRGIEVPTHPQFNSI
jgi:2-isopropylmalate synthase